MRLDALVCLALLGTAQAAEPFPWTRGYLDVGPSVSQPLAFNWDGREFSVPVGGWARQPLEVGLDVVWSSAPVTPVKATLTPGVPVKSGPVWTVPVGVRTNLTTPAVVAIPTAASARIPAGAAAGLRIAFPLAVNPAVPAPRPLATGQEFLRVGGDVVYRRGDDVLLYPELTGRVLTLRRLEARRAVFWAEGLGEVVRGGDPGKGFDDLAPLVPDPGLPALKKKYEGRTVWAYGGLRGVCSSSPESAYDVEVNPREPLKIRRVVRLALPLILNVGSGSGDEAGQGADSIALTPLVFLLDGRPFQSDGSFSASGAAAETFRSSMSSPGVLPFPSGCGTNFPAYLPDTWAAERVFSLTPPSAAVPAEAPANPQGLTRWQYAWLFGFPSATFGTRDELLKKTVWAYRNIPFPATVTFGAAGKVRNVEVPRLP